MLDEPKLHVAARQIAEDMTARGASFDKKMLRWNDVVAVGVFYSDCGAAPSLATAILGIKEALDACNKNDPAAHVSGRGPLSMIQEWMRNAGRRPPAEA